MSTLLGRIKVFILVAGDIAILYLALLATLVLRYGQNCSLQWQEHFFPFSIIYAFWILAFYIIGLYEISMARNNLYFFITLAKVLAIDAGLAIIFFYFFPFFKVTPKTNLFINLLIFAVLFVAWRQFFNRFIRSRALLNNVLVIGQSQEAKELIRYINDSPQLGYRIKKIVEPNEVEILYDLTHVIAQDRIQVIITSVNPHKNSELVRNLYQCIPLKITLADLPSFYEKITGKVPVSAIEEVWFLENLMTGKKIVFEAVKRVFDMIASILGGIIALILYPFIALAIKLDSSGPIFYSQKRVGQDNKIFEVVKFRSMIKNAEENGAQWAKKNDGRITRVGNFLRKTRLDELPQLWNILKGDMSFVGPRPERPEFAFSNEILSEIPFYQIRHTIKPGLTGWAQIKYPYGSSIKDTLQKLQYDLYYIKNRSLFLEAAIILKTVKTVLSGGGR
ncbi:MAG: putative glycosyltransferase [Parcubacteria group bacterium GW2011_GWB1_42_6]|nr:MAG: putative glycosyltransferase [Parcubacteria group bacterium GW2011_GWB1_42_6]